MLKRFANVRALLAESAVDRTNHWITGKLAVSEEVRLELLALDADGHIELFKVGDHVRSVPDLQLAPGQTVEATITLKRGNLQYFEDVAELVHTGNKAEPPEYIVHGLGEFQRDVVTRCEQIALYRETLRARRLIKLIADHSDGDQAFVLTPKKLEFLFRWKPEQMRRINCLDSLEKTLAVGVTERDQRLALFHRNLHSRLAGVSVEERFAAFLDRADEIDADFYQDYQLWLGTTFTEIQKNFEEKRLKFITELTAILTNIQASILALPIAALLAADKYDANSPVKDVALAIGITSLAAFTWKLLENQKHALDATAVAISSAESDFSTKNPTLKTEVAARLANVVAQRTRVENLVRALRIGIPSIVAIAWLAVCWAFVETSASRAGNQSTASQISTGTPAGSGTVSPSPGHSAVPDATKPLAAPSPHSSQSPLQSPAVAPPIAASPTP